eukprot:TRINITY_DN606_c2_g1_i7.p1 TRINITY_DN606_c2_g1~~TRINITY_DN606_c2_g1_i7.p1  ORF type:complete len:800 (+),score=290.47 TRINITY_DN606_c2_g1_i7:46-2445(+)
MGNEQGVLSDEELKKRAITKMDLEMKKKFSKGAQFNMRIIIRGDINTGKSCLFHRLQGRGFSQSYQPTEKIQISHIHWNYKIQDDIVKVEVWDVVDKAKTKKSKEATSLKLTNEEAQPDEDIEIPDINSIQNGTTGNFQVASLDASTIDVMKGANAVIFTCDPRRVWTWEYVKRELPKIENGLPVLVLSNYRDLGTEGVKVTYAEMVQFCKDVGDNIECIESSMLNCYGLKSVKSFLNIPFLHMKLVYLQDALRIITDESHAAQEEFHLVNEQSDYNKYVVSIQQKAQAVTRADSQPELARAASAPPTSASTSNNSSNSGSTTTSPRQPQHPTSPQSSPTKKTDNNAVEKAPSSSNNSQQQHPQQHPQQQPQQQQNQQKKKESSSSFFSFMSGGIDGLLGSSDNKKEPTSKQPKKNVKSNEEVVKDLKKLSEDAKMGRTSGSQQSVDDFIPEGEEDVDDWFKDTPTSRFDSKNDDKKEGSDDDYNPLVAKDSEPDLDDGHDYKFETKKFTEVKKPTPPVPVKSSSEELTKKSQSAPVTTAPTPASLPKSSSSSGNTPTLNTKVNVNPPPPSKPEQNNNYGGDDSDDDDPWKMRDDYKPKTKSSSNDDDNDDWDFIPKDEEEAEDNFDFATLSKPSSSSSSTSSLSRPNNPPPAPQAAKPTSNVPKTKSNPSLGVSSSSSGDFDEEQFRRMLAAKEEQMNFNAGNSGDHGYDDLSGDDSSSTRNRSEYAGLDEDANQQSQYTGLNDAPPVRGRGNVRGRGPPGRGPMRGGPRGGRPMRGGPAGARGGRAAGGRGAPQQPQ